MSNDAPPWHLGDTAFARPHGRSDAQWLWKLVSRPEPKISSHVEQGGLIIDEAYAPSALFTAAAAAIDLVADLAEIVRIGVEHVHILKAPPGYDISHSEPHWPNRVFVSLSDRSDEVGALRLAENVIHEAMHLHLTVFEQDAPLVRELIGQIWSPWRQSLRSFGGVIHGLFVFACLREYFARLTQHHEDAKAHIRQRLKDIDTEIGQIDISHLTAGLTSDGQALVTNLLGRLDSRHK